MFHFKEIPLTIPKVDFSLQKGKFSEKSFTVCESLLQCMWPKRAERVRISSLTSVVALEESEGQCLSRVEPSQISFRTGYIRKR